MSNRIRILLACCFAVALWPTLRAQSTYSTPYAFSTLVGLATTAGAADGTGSAARFSNTEGVAVDAAGNIYLADLYGHAIRKITSTGVVTTFAGSLGVSGSADGTGGAARFNYPVGVAVDSAGNIYVGDACNKTVRKVTPAGAVTTLAGSAGLSGSTDGTGSAARLGGWPDINNPQMGVAVDQSGNVYVADALNHTIRKITAAGVVTTLAGSAGLTGATDGTGSAARFNLPVALVPDAAGNLYVADRNNHLIRKVTPAGVVTTLAGGFGSADGTFMAARFYAPGGIALDASGNFYVADSLNNTIRRLGNDGLVSTLAGSPLIEGSTDGTGSAVRFFTPGGIAVDGSGKLYVSDHNNYTVRRGVLATPVVAVTSETTNTYVTTGSTGTYRVRITYTGQTPSGMGVSLSLPTGWTFGSYSGPGTAAQPSVGDNVLEWAYSTFPSNELTFTFTVDYPTGQSGTKSLTGSVNYRPGPVTVAFTNLNLTPVVAPTITTQPASRLAGVGTGTTFTVVASGTAPLTYQWKKNGGNLTDGGSIAGATTATLSLSTLTTGDGGSYTVAVTNAGGTATSNAAILTVVDAQATHAVVGAGYVAGGTVTLTQTLNYTGTCAGLGWQLLLPTGWTYASGGGTEGDVKPSAGTSSLLEWAWTSVPASPVTFTVTLNVPAGDTGDRTVTGLTVFRVSAGAANLLVTPDPLVVSQVTTHSADTDRNFRVSLFELTRVIELYNTRNGTSRTGCYAVQAGTEDGFAPDAARLSTATVTLASYHAADSDHNGKVSLFELTRVIELYNTRAGTSRTGAYHALAGTEDGFAPGP